MIRRRVVMAVLAMAIAVCVAMDLVARARGDEHPEDIHPALLGGEQKSQPCWSCHDQVPGGCAHCHWPGPTPEPFVPGP